MSLKKKIIIIEDQPLLNNMLKKTLENEYNNITFLTFDFKKNNGQDIGVAISKKLDIYRQNYCGCEFSRNK